MYNVQRLVYAIQAEIPNCCSSSGSTRSPFSNVNKVMDNPVMGLQMIL